MVSFFVMDISQEWQTQTADLLFDPTKRSNILYIIHDVYIFSVKIYRYILECIDWLVGFTSVHQRQRKI